jgi:hypothetical protein
MMPIKDIMYAFVRKNGHVVWKDQWYIVMSRVSLQTNLYMTHENKVLVADVAVTSDY